MKMDSPRGDRIVGMAILAFPIALIYAGLGIWLSMPDWLITYGPIWP